MPISALFRKRFYACLIGPEVDDAALIKFAAACKAYEPYIAAAVVNPCQVPVIAPVLQETSIQLVAPVAYPAGNLPTEIKTVQVEQAISDGAAGIAAVMKVEALRAGDYADARNDAAAIAEACASGLIALALIGSCASLNAMQSIEAARMARGLGAAFVTSVGFGAESRPGHVEIIRQALSNDVRIIAAGGCRTAEQAAEHLHAGADGIATSTPFQIIQQIENLPPNAVPA